MSQFFIGWFNQHHDLLQILLIYSIFTINITFSMTWVPIIRSVLIMYFFANIDNRYSAIAHLYCFEQSSVLQKRVSYNLKRFDCLKYPSNISMLWFIDAVFCQDISAKFGWECCIPNFFIYCGRSFFIVVVFVSFFLCKIT